MGTSSIVTRRDLQLGFGLVTGFLNGLEIWVPSYCNTDFRASEFMDGRGFGILDQVVTPKIQTLHPLSVKPQVRPPEPYIL